MADGGSWSEPVVESGDWCLQCVPRWTEALKMVEPWREVDSLAEADWQKAVAVLDQQPEPVSVPAANARWRAFVCCVWAMRNGVMRRRAGQHKALAVRRAKKA